jgi:uncharacterized integral membrane protein
MRVIITVVLTLGLVTILAFVLMNSSHLVDIRFLPGVESEEYPVSLVVLVSLLVGVVFASIIGIVEGTRLRLQNHQLRGRIKKLETEVQTLRTGSFASPAQAALDEDSVL